MHPTYSPAPPCEAFQCKWRMFRLEDCEERACPHSWQRQGARDREEQKLKDLHSGRISTLGYLNLRSPGEL